MTAPPVPCYYDVRMTYEPYNQDDNQPATRGDLRAWKDEILTSEDKVIKKLDQVLTEQQAITINYKRLDQQVENLIDFAEKAAPKLDLEFKKV